MAPVRANWRYVPPPLYIAEFDDNVRGAAPHSFGKLPEPWPGPDLESPLTSLDQGETEAATDLLEVLKLQAAASEDTSPDDRAVLEIQAVGNAYEIQISRQQPHGNKNDAAARVATGLARGAETVDGKADTDGKHDNCHGQENSHGYAPVRGTLSTTRCRSAAPAHRLSEPRAWPLPDSAR